MGEKSKRSGEIGETIASELLKLIGWNNSLHNISIDCTSPQHLNGAGNPKTTHGEDQIFIYHNPFHDDQTEIVHISVKHSSGKFPGEATLKRKFKEHLEELQETIECAKFSPPIKSILTSHGSKEVKSVSAIKPPHLP